MAFEVKTFVRRHLHEPLWKRFWFTDLRKFLNQLQTNPLKNICCFFARQSIANRDRKDQFLVLVDKQVPVFFMPLQAALHNLPIRFSWLFISWASQRLHWHLAAPAGRRNN